LRGPALRSAPVRTEKHMTLDFRAGIAARVEAAKASPGYANYLRVRDYICTMMDDWERLDPDGGPSAYWREEVSGEGCR